MQIQASFHLVYFTFFVFIIRGTLDSFRDSSLIVGDSLFHFQNYKLVLTIFRCIDSIFLVTLTV
jgi:hypothetical protein